MSSMSCTADSFDLSASFVRMIVRSRRMTESLKRFEEDAELPIAVDNDAATLKPPKESQEMNGGCAGALVSGMILRQEQLPTRDPLPETARERGDGRSFSTSSSASASTDASIPEPPQTCSDVDESHGTGMRSPAEVRGHDRLSNVHGKRSTDPVRYVPQTMPPPEKQPGSTAGHVSTSPWPLDELNRGQLILPSWPESRSISSDRREGEGAERARTRKVEQPAKKKKQKKKKKKKKKREKEKKRK